MASVSCRARSAGLGEARFRRLGYVVITLPTFVLELDCLDPDRVGIGVQRLIFKIGHPSPIHLKRKGDLAGLVVDLDNEVLPEVLQGTFGTAPGSEVPDFVCPSLEVDIVSNTAFQRDRLVLGAPRRFARGRGIAAFAMLYDLGGAFTLVDFSVPRHVASITL